MRRMSTELLEQVRVGLLRERPLTVKEIDFTNPYFTQPKSAARDTSGALLDRLAGAPVRHIYVHVPFCATRCRYCHYPTLTNVHTEDVQATFLRQLEAEISHFVSSPLDLSAVSTVHVGGGTPNCLSDDNLDRLIDLLVSRFRPQHEFAVELYPTRADLTERKLAHMRHRGVNRISIGVQTFDDQVNELNARTGQPRETSMELIQLAQQYCGNVSLDLLYGQKGQDLAVLESDCDIASELRVNSVYLYQTRELIHKAALELQQALNLFLATFSSRGYDIVSFDQVIRKRNSDGFCIHRSGRSLCENLLGLGPGAVSEIGDYIFRNRSPEMYARDGFGLAPDGVVKRSKRTQQAEYLNRSLRHYNDPRLNGTWVRSYHERYGSSMLVDFAHELECLGRLGLVQCDAEKCEITDLGMHFTQQINYYLLGHYK